MNMMTKALTLIGALALSVLANQPLHAQTTTYSMSGRLTLQGIAPTSPPQTITFTFRLGPKYDSFVRTVSVAPSGNFLIEGLAPGGYQVHIKGSKYLARNINADMRFGNAKNIAATLLVGDINDDNAINDTDVRAFIPAFSSQPGDARWNPNADLDGNGVVDNADFNLLRPNVGMVGDL